jgi:hypothetical protein
MNESASDPVDDKSGIAETITTALRQPSFLRVMLVLAATVVVLVGIRLGAPILNPILFAVVLALLFSPVYSWLLRRGLPAPLALLGMLVLLTVLFLGLIFILGGSISRFTERLGFYTTQLNGQVDSLDALIERLALVGGGWIALSVLRSPPRSTTSLDRCSALESRLIRRKWSRILRLFESESDKIGPRDRLSPSRNHSMQDFLPALQYLTK